MAFFQYTACSALSLITAAIFETTTLSGVLSAALPILYGGVCSVGIAYTLQVVAPSGTARPHASFLLSLEAVFAP